MRRANEFWQLQHAQVNDAGGAGGGAPAGGAAAGAGDAGGAGDKGAGGEGSLLSSVNDGAAAGGAAANADGTATITIDDKTGRPSNVPEKFWNSETKAIRSDAVLKSYTELEKRAGSGELAPANADDYKLDTVIEEVKKATGVDVPAMDPELSKSFRAAAKEIGLSQKQYEGVMKQYLSSIPAMASAAFEIKMAEGKTELSKVWKTEAEMNRELGFAKKAYMAYAPEELRKPEVMNAIGNNPIILRVLANIGKELKEDTRVAGDLPAIGNDLKALRRSEPYWNAKHPDHAATVERVAQLYKAQSEAKQRAGG